MQRYVAALVLFFLAGCEARLASLGATCTRAGDCSAPFVCILGRCREECIADADCPLGASCFRDGGSIGGVCTLDSEARCSSSVCPEPLTCVLDVCRGPCAADGDCLASQRCASSACVPRELSDAGATDAESGDAGPIFPVARPCGTDAECGLGEICASDNTPRVCRTACDAHEDCAPPSACDYYGDLSIDGGYVLGCSTVCEPGTANGCVGGQTCRPVLRSGGALPAGPAVILLCDDFDARNVEGCPCPGRDSSAVCAEGLLCSDPGVCRRLCILGGPECEPGVPCMPDERTITVDGDTWGLCPEPTTAPTSCAP